MHLPRKVTLELHQVLRLPLHEVWRRLYLTLLDTTLLDSTLLDSTLLDTTLLDSTLLDSTLLDTTLLDSTLLDSTLLDTTLLDSTLLDSTLLDTTLLDSTLLDSTLLDTTLLETTLLDSTLLDTTLLDLTLLRCRSYIGSFWAKLPLIIYCAVSLLTGFHDAFSGRDQHGGEGGMLGKVQSLVLGWHNWMRNTISHNFSFCKKSGMFSVLTRWNSEWYLWQDRRGTRKREAW